MAKKMIRVQFFSGDSHANVAGNNLYAKEYDYFLVQDDEVAVKDGFAVVEVGGTLKIVKVVGVLKHSAKATRYAITTFSLDAHKNRIERERNIDELKAAILVRAEEARERRRLEELAGSDEELSRMLGELRDLESGTVTETKE